MTAAWLSERQPRKRSPGATGQRKSGSALTLDPVQNSPHGFCKSGPAEAEAHILHFSRDLKKAIDRWARATVSAGPKQRLPRAPSDRCGSGPIMGVWRADVTAPRCRQRGKARRNSMFFLRQVKRRGRPQLRHVAHSARRSIRNKQPNS